MEVSFTSCVRDIVLDASGRPVVVVECILSDKETQELRLNFTKGASKTEADSLTEAVATLIDLTESQTVGQFERQKGDLWTLDYSAVPNHHYRLEVQVPGYDLIWSEDTMPNKIQVIRGHCDAGGMVEDFFYPEYIPYSLFLKYPCKKNKGIFLRGSFYYLKEQRNPFIVYGMNYNPETGTHEIAEEICTDHPSVTSTTNSRKYVAPIIIESHPHIQLYPMLNGFPINNRYLLFPKGAIDEEHIFLISGSFTGDWPTYDKKTPSETDGYLVFLSYSNGYGNYLDDALKLTELKKSSDMSTIYLRDNVYSNITGGLGIFGGVCVQHQIWNKTYTDMMAWEEFWKKCDEGYYDDWGAWMYGPYISENSGVEELVEQGLLTLKQF